MRIDSRMYKQPGPQNKIRSRAFKEFDVTCRHAVPVTVKGRFATLVIPQVVDRARSYPFKGVVIVVTQELGKVFEAKQFVDALAGVWPTIGDVAKGNEVVVVSVKVSAVEALAQSAVCPMDVTYDECFCHRTFKTADERSIKFFEPECR